MGGITEEEHRKFIGCKKNLAKVIAGQNVETPLKWFFCSSKEYLQPISDVATYAAVFSNNFCKDRKNNNKFYGGWRTRNPSKPKSVVCYWDIANILGQPPIVGTMG